MAHRLGLALALFVTGQTGCGWEVRPPPPLVTVDVQRGDNAATLTELRRPPVIGRLTLAPGDRVAFHVFGEPELAVADARVMPDGTLGLPLVGAWPAAGKTTEEVQQQVAVALRRYLQRPHVTIRTLETSSCRFSIVGAVEKPGVYSFARPVRLTGAIALAGGLRQGLYRSSTVSLADLSRAYLARAGKILPVSFVRLFAEQDLSHDVYVHPGDLIYVPSSLDAEIFVLGRVEQPRAYNFRGSATLVQVITYAGGLTTEARASEVRLIRGGLHDPEVYVVDLEAIFDGEAADVPLQPGDIVFVPETPLAAWNDVVKQILPTLEGLARIKYLAAGN